MEITPKIAGTRSAYLGFYQEAILDYVAVKLALMQHKGILLLLIIVNIPVYAFFTGIFFGGGAGLRGNVGKWIDHSRKDRGLLNAAVRGMGFQTLHGWAAEQEARVIFLRVGGWLLTCALMVLSEFALLVKFGLISAT